MAEKSTEATTQLIDSYVKNVVSPHIESFVEMCGIPYKSLLIPKCEHFEKYLNRIYEKYSIINTLVFHNSQRQLKDIYLAQSLRIDGCSENCPDVAAKIDKLPVELIEKYKRILINDTAGMGKSTIMKRMFIDVIDNSIKDVGIPIYIELNRLNKNRNLLSVIFEDLSSSSKDINVDWLLTLIQSGGFFFLLDGFDEISIADRNDVIKDIQSFISKAGSKNYYILTSRPEDSLKSFGDFRLFNIQPLSKDDAFELLKKYDLSNGKEVSRKLIKLLNTGQYESIDEYLENPLLASLLFAAFDHKQIIPLKKHQFYRQVYDAYFDSHDLTKGIDAHQKQSGLDIDDFNRVLRYVGYECLIRIGVQFDKDRILNTIERAKEFCGNLKFGSNYFLQDLLIAVPLFTKDGTEYKWAHKSLMEYFAARFIAEDTDDKKDEILSAMYNSENFEKFINMLDLYYDIDLKGFSKNITLPFCEQFIKFYNDNFFRVPSNISNDLIEERISCFYFNKNMNMIFAVVSDNNPLTYNMYLNDVFLKYHSHFIDIQNYDAWVCFVVTGVFSRTRNAVWARLLLSKGVSIVTEPRGSDAYRKLLNDGFPQEVSLLEHYRSYVAVIETGYQSDEFYKGINLILLKYFKSDVICDYEACKKEVERIRKEIDKSKNTSDLLFGI